MLIKQFDGVSRFVVPGDTLGVVAHQRRKLGRYNINSIHDESTVRRHDLLRVLNVHRGVCGAHAFVLRR